tara:strand:- start:129 stop:548 length:420 start_codon:yes stop_codon:yes gene_type:complete
MLDLDTPTNLAVATDTEWNYDQSVVKMRQLVVRWKNLSLEILRELYLARMNLSDRASRNQVGWSQYLNDIGLSSSTVYRWLAKYDFDNDELVPSEPIRLPKEIEIDDVLPTTHSCPNCGYEYDGVPVESERGLDTTRTR